MANFDISVIRDLCSSVMLDCNSNEITSISDGLAEMIKWIEKIKTINLEDSLTDNHKDDSSFLYNEDIVDNKENSAIKNRYLKDNDGVISDYFVVPKVMEGEDE